MNVASLASLPQRGCLKSSPSCSTRLQAPLGLGMRRRPNVRCFASENPELVQSRREILLQYVQDVQPAVMEGFQEKAMPEVLDAMRQTVTNMIGTLPPQFFNVTISSMGEHLAQLMLSVLMTGYLFRNAQYRLELRRSIYGLTDGASPATPAMSAPAALPAAAAATAAPSTQTAVPLTALAAPPPSAMDPATPGAFTLRQFSDKGFAPGVQSTRVAGHVSLWHPDRGLETLPAIDYVRLLEDEVRQLRQELVAASNRPSGPAGTGAAPKDANPLLDYLKGLDPNSLAQLTSGAGDDVVEAMQAFVARLLGTTDPAQLQKINSQTSSQELSQLLFWLLVTGYSLRSMELRFEMEQTLSGGGELGNSNGEGSGQNKLNKGPGPSPRGFLPGF